MSGPALVVGSFGLALLFLAWLVWLDVLAGRRAPHKAGGIVPQPEVVKEVVRDVVTREFIPVGEGVRMVYRATSRRHQHELEQYSLWRRYPEVVPARPRPEAPDWHGQVFLSCEAAFAAYGDDVKLEQLQAFVHDGKAYTIGTEMQVAKPRIRVDGGGA